ncbi:unnamed protein product [Prunus armeniaca]
MQPANHYFSIEFFQSANHMEQLLFYMLERNYPFFFFFLNLCWASLVVHIFHLVPRSNSVLAQKGIESKIGFKDESSPSPGQFSLLFPETTWEVSTKPKKIYILIYC